MDRPDLGYPGKTMKQAVIYRRVSTAKQDDEGKSLEDQDAELVVYCRAMGFEVVGNYSDKISGRREKIGKRVGLEKAIAMACELKATFVVYDLDRLARSQSAGMRIVEQLQDCGAKLVVKSLGIDTNTPAGEMIVGIMFAVAQWGSRNIGEGVKRANRQTVKEKGHRTQGEQRFGWMLDANKNLVKCPEEQEFLCDLRKLRRGHGSLHKLVKFLNESGATTPANFRRERQGKPPVESRWHVSAICKLLA